MVAVSQAPSPESNPDSPLPVTTMPNSVDANVDIITSTVDELIETDTYEDNKDEYVLDSEETSDSDTDRNSDDSFSKMLTKAIFDENAIQQKPNNIINIVEQNRKKQFKQRTKASTTIFRNLHHSEEKEVQDYLKFPKNTKEGKQMRRNVLALLRNEVNFESFVENEEYNTEKLPCTHCKRIVAAKYLRRHYKKCIVKPINETGRNVRHRSASQTLVACASEHANITATLRVKKEVFSRMASDEIGFVARRDSLIRHFGEFYLKKHKRAQIAHACANKMREFDDVVLSAKAISGYDGEKKTYQASSLALHLGTTLQQVCELTTHLLLKTSPEFKCDNLEERLKQVKRFRFLVQSQWSNEVSSLALKNLVERKWNKPVILPLTKDITKFRSHSLECADRSVALLKKFAKFMGHTVKTHQQFYEITQDAYQTAKVAKLLNLFDKGKGEEYRSAALESINIDPNNELVESDDNSKNGEPPLLQSTQSSKLNNYQEGGSSDGKDNEIDTKVKKNYGKSRKTMAALAYEYNRAVKATTMDCCATSGIGIACGNRHPSLKIYFTIKLTLNLTLNVVKLEPKVFLKTSITLGGLFPEFTSNCPTSLQKWIFKSATTSTKTTATSEPARSSKTVATTQPPTSSNNVEQAKEVGVEELPSKPPTSANTPVQNRLKSEIADLTLKIKKLQDFAQQKLREKKKLEAPQTLPKPKRGRPPIEKEQEGLQEAILNLVYYGASADDRRKSDILKCAKTHIRDLAELLGPQAVNVLSVDDKARVPLGLPAAQKQAPKLMRYERQILMPDHDYPIAKGLKLIPSVIDVLCFKDWKVSYSGPTCISTRGGAIDSSTAETHRQDLIKYLHHDKMRDYFWSNNRIKPVLVVFSDGGKLRARNPVERRMAPLSRDLCRLIIPHDVCGTHLDARGRTIDKVLEKKNFEAAGRILAEVWDRTVIDGFEVIAQYVPPASTAASESTEANDDESCCSPMISRLRLYLEDGFLPAPVMFRHGLYGLEACSQENMDGRFLDISQRLQNASLVPVKPLCKKYFFRKASLTKHGKIHKNLATIFELAEEEIETEVVSSIDEGGVQIIEDMEAWMQPIYEDDTGN
ncbi:hypothetical protein ILUMI_07839 [Ignelater luminosus]|uniref:Uncharacterized protein n=1 Tax=Ignelater luminosus TaxID=2038154 RepID=A0A8K0GB82_IGNLU|nr:hypothetical protein ILUMI_07839 [Ignelater luminosus]